MYVYIFFLCPLRRMTLEQRRPGFPYNTIPIWSQQEFPGFKPCLMTWGYFFARHHSFDSISQVGYNLWKRWLASILCLMFVVANQWFFVVARYADRLSHVLHSYVQMNGKRSVVNGYIGTANNGRYLIYFHGLPIANIDFSLGSLFTGKEKMVHPIILIASPERSLHKMMSRRGRPSDHHTPPVHSADWGVSYFSITFESPLF